MPQEVIERVNQLGAADEQPEVLTFYDRKGRLIGETKTQGVPDIVNTNIPDNEDGLEDLNPPTVNEDYGVVNLQDIPHAIAETAEQPEDPVHESEVPEEDLQVQDTNDEGDQDLQQPPEPIPTCQIQDQYSLVAQRARAKPQ